MQNDEFVVVSNEFESLSDEDLNEIFDVVISSDLYQKMFSADDIKKFTRRQKIFFLLRHKFNKNNGMAAAKKLVDEFKNDNVSISTVEKLLSTC